MNKQIATVRDIGPLLKGSASHWRRAKKPVVIALTVTVIFAAVGLVASLAAAQGNEYATSKVEKVMAEKFARCTAGYASYLSTVKETSVQNANEDDIETLMVWHIVMSTVSSSREYVDSVIREEGALEASVRKNMLFKGELYNYLIRLESKMDVCNALLSEQLPLYRDRVAQFLGTSAPKSGWVSIYSDNGHDESYDAGSLQVNKPGQGSVWLKISLSDEDRVGYSKLAEMQGDADGVAKAKQTAMEKRKAVVSCGSTVVTYTVTEAYDSNGKLISTYDNPDHPQVLSVGPGSTEEALYQLICGK